MHSPPSADGARILVVDDEPSITEMLTVSLRFVGFEVAGPLELAALRETLPGEARAARDDEPAN